MAQPAKWLRCYLLFLVVRPKLRLEAPIQQSQPLPERLLLDLHAACNLACPMCLLHGDASESPDKAAALGTMTLENAKLILDEVMEAKPLIQPAFWGEPFLNRDLRRHIAAMKARGIAVALNTNGLTFREHHAKMLVEQKVDAIFFSFDATTPETLKIVRGVDKLDKISAALKLMLRVRTELGSILPRVGATFTIQQENAHELEEFIDRWITVADLVRVGLVFANGRLTELGEPVNRKPCAMLYQTMPIHHDGDVSMCCWDSHKRAVMGNVFKDGGVAAVWHGEKFAQVRKHHEAGEFAKVPFCKDCNAWAGHLYTEEITERNGVPVLIRRSSDSARSSD